MSAPWAGPTLPEWEETDLEQMSAAGQLSGLAPGVLGVIDKAESSGVGGGFNGTYGGFFGASTSPYAGGESITPAEMSGTSSADFEAQATVAADAFNSYLSQTGGNPVDAEGVYQTGGNVTSKNGVQQTGAGEMVSDGPKLMEEYFPAVGSAGGAAGSSGTPTTSTGVPAVPASATTTGGLNANPFDLFGIPQTVAGDAAASVWTEIGPFLAKAMLVMTGLTIIILGVFRFGAQHAPNVSSMAPGGGSGEDAGSSGSAGSAGEIAEMAAV